MLKENQDSKRRQTGNRIRKNAEIVTGSKKIIVQKEDKQVTKVAKIHSLLPIYE